MRPSRLRLCFLQSDLSLTEWVTLPACVSVHQLSLSLSHYFLSDLMKNTTVITIWMSLKVPLRVLVESISRVSHTLVYPGSPCHPCKSQSDKSKSQPANTKVSRTIVRQKALCTRYGPEFNSTCYFTIIFAPSVVVAKIKLIDRYVYWHSNS